MSPDAHSGLAGGFPDPVADAQACFRAVLDAMAHPGRVSPAGRAAPPEAPLPPAMAAVLLTLVDADTKLWIDPGFAPAASWIAFHCGAVAFAAPAPGGFVLARHLPDLAQMPCGSDAAPQDSVTIILGVASLEHGAAFRLSGPGLRVPATLRVAGLPDDFAARWAANHALFPRGVDLLLCAGEHVAALPRSVAVA